MNTAEVVATLREMYPVKEYAFLEEVPNATGFGANRHADVVVMSLWPSRGMEITGFEVKVSRSDWMRELRNPGKSAPIQKYCDRWIVACGESGIVHDGELPPTWGLMETTGTKLKIKTAAPKLEAQRLDRDFVAAVLRRASEQSTSKALIKAEVEKALERERKHQSENKRFDLTDTQTELANLKERVAEFEKESGIRIERWGMGNVAAAVRVLSRDGAHGARESLIGLKSHAKRIYDELCVSVEQLEIATAGDQQKPEEEIA